MAKTRWVARCSLVLALSAISLLFAPQVAAGKGDPAPTTYGVIQGPELPHPIVYRAGGTWQRGYRGEAAELFLNFATRAGIFHEDSSSPLRQRPMPWAELGPLYRVSYFVDGFPEVVRQDLYPYAEGGPWTYTPPGQSVAFRRVFGPGAESTGWLRAFEGRALLTSLRAGGLPSYAPVAEDRRPETGSPALDTRPPRGLRALGAFAVLAGLLSFGAWRWRRQQTRRMA